MEAIRDLGPGWEDAAAVAFLARVERRIDALVEQRVQERLRATRMRRGSMFKLVVCLFFALPLAFIAGQYAGLDGILAVLGVVLLLNWDMIIPG
jgi:hypothetical protein